MTVSRLVVIEIITAHTATVKTSRAAYLLDEAHAPKQYDATRKCWTTSTRTLPDFLAYLETRKRPHIVEQARLL